MTDCKIIQDLLPLYTDDICSKESRALVEEHLKSCEKCKIELDDMKSEVRVRFNNESEANVFKAMKKKLFKKNMIVALISVSVSIAVLVGVYNYIFTHHTVIPYKEGLVSAEIHTVKTVQRPDGTTLIITENQTTEVPFTVENVLDIDCTENIFCINTTAKEFVENGQRIKLFYLNFSKTIAMNWDKSDGLNQFARVIEPQTVGENDDCYIDRYEVYYLDINLNEVSDVDLDEFIKFKESGVLVWRGDLE